MEEEVGKEEKKNEIFNTKINFYDELIDIQLTIILKKNKFIIVETNLS